MTQFSKVFTVFVTMASLAFMGFAAVTVVGGPNYQAEQVEQLPDYVFELSPGEQPTWAVKTRQAQETVPASPSTLPGAIVGARKHLDARLQGEIDELDKQIPVVEAKIIEARELIEIDLKGLEKREQELQSELETLQATIKDISNQSIKKSQESQAVRAEAARRREDVFRLLNQLEEIRTDHFRAVEQARKLDEQLVRIHGSIDRSRQRYEQLQGYDE